MSRSAHFEIWTGLSGDMFVGACLDAGWPEHSLQEMVNHLGIPDLHVRVETRKQGSLVGKGIQVLGNDPQPHRHLEDIARILGAAALDPAVRERALLVFQALAEAEARVHGSTPNSIHFHEVGALDAIVDITAAVQALHDLGVETLTADPIPVHRGSVQCAHGTLPTPAPATGFLLQGWPIRAGDGEGEWITPTGAALLRTLGKPSENMPALHVEAVGLGAGTKTHPTLPNLARLWVGTPRLSGFVPSAESDKESQREANREANKVSGGGRVSVQPVTVLETQVDDLTGEELGGLAERLRRAGALDVTLEPLLMKKGRPGSLLRTIVRPPQEESMVQLLFEHSSTLGVRSRIERRWERWREVREVSTPWGLIRIKFYEAGAGTRWSVEFDELTRVAAEHETSVAVVRDRIDGFLQAPKRGDG